jgi:hypothetical protein
MGNVIHRGSSDSQSRSSMCTMATCSLKARELVQGGSAARAHKVTKAGPNRDGLMALMADARH